MTRALHQTAGMSATLLMPAYRGTLEHLTDVHEVAVLSRLPGGEARLLAGRCAELDDLPVLLLQNDALYDRDGIYVDAEGRDFPDNALRYAALSHAAARIAAGATVVPAPDIVHAHDWHTGLVPLLLRAAGLHHVKSVVTIHNLAFQGWFPMSLAPELGIPERFLTPDGMEFWGQLNFLKAGIRYADRITTVSHNYAKEILTDAFGCGLQGLLHVRQADLVPIANGIDMEEWDPARDPHLPFHFDDGDLDNKAHCKFELQRWAGLDANPKAPVLAICSRLTHQKMADVAVHALPRALDDHPGLQVVILGQGEKALEAELTQLQRRYPGRVGVRIGFDETSAHRVHAGADILLHGSRFEPFGLTPLYSMRYGTIPIGSRVGGMVDTIQDPGVGAGREAMRNATGVLFEGDSVDAMAAAIERTLSLYRRPAIWRAMQHRGMTSDFSWSRTVPAYVTLYRSLKPSAVLESAAPALQPARAPASAGVAQPGKARGAGRGAAALPAAGLSVPAGVSA
jgi:starch synthase